MESTSQWLRKLAGRLSEKKMVGHGESFPVITPYERFELLKIANHLEPNWPRPIPVSERLPEPDVLVLAYCECPNNDLATGWQIAIAPDDDNKWCVMSPTGNRQQQAVTHWLPMPPRPE